MRRAFAGISVWQFLPLLLLLRLRLLSADTAACGAPTFVMPYIVVGRMMVSSGVLWRGVLDPNTAMVLGAYTARSWAAASSSTFWMPCVFT